MSTLDKLSDAFDEDDFSKFQKLVDGLKSIDAVDKNWEQSPLVMVGAKLAFSPDKIKYAEYLLDKGAKIEQTCGSMSPLGNAAHSGLVEWMKVLIERGADVNYCEPGNYPPVLRAVENDQVGALKILLDDPKIDLDAAKEAAYGESLAKFSKKKKAVQCIDLLKEMKIK